MLLQVGGRICGHRAQQQVPAESRAALVSCSIVRCCWSVAALQVLEGACAIGPSSAPELAGDLERINTYILPPEVFAPRAMQRPVMAAAEGNGELAAHLVSVVGVGLVQSPGRAVPGRPGRPLPSRDR